MMTKSIRSKMAEGSKKESVSDGAKPTSICGFFLKHGKCYRAHCKFSHKINTEEKCEDLKEEGSGDCLDSATKPPTYLPEECIPVRKEKMPSSQVNAELGRVGKPLQEINEEELKESLKCEMLENCTPQFCCTCQEDFSSQLISNAHYAGKPHEKLLQMKLKVMLRKKISKENLRKKQGDSELINSATISTEIKQIVTAEMSGEKNSTKEETRKRPGDHLDENLCVVDNKYETAVCNLPSNWLEKPTYCGVCSIALNENSSRTHYVGKPHKKKLKLLEIEPNRPPPQPQAQNSNDYTCSLCQVASTSKVDFVMHLQGSKHKSKEAKQEALKPHCGTEKVKTKQLLGKLTLFCDVCNVSFTNEEQLKGHLNGKPHAKKLKFFSKPTFFCDVCNVSCTNEENLKKHLIGKPHAKTLRLFMELNKATFDGEVCGIKTVDKKSLELHLQADSQCYSVVEGKEENQETGVAQKTVTEEAKESMSMQTAEMMNENTSEKSVIKAEEMDDGEANDIPGLNHSMSKLSSDGEPGQENMVEEMENTFGVESKESLSGTESMPVQAAVIMDEKMSDEKTDGCEEKDIPDLSDSMVRKLAGHNDTDTEFMSMQTTVVMNGSTSEISAIKDEEMDDGGDKDVPDLTDSMNNLEGYGDVIKKKELKSTLKLKEKELLHPAEIDKTPTSETLEKEDIVLVTENIELIKSVKGYDEHEEAASSDDDLIILENPDSSSPRKSIQNTQNLNNAHLAEGGRLCVYPLGQSESVTVSTQDYATLAYDTFLNDIIIDFYLLYLANNVLSNSDKEKVHIFSTMFYKRLMQSPRADAKKVPEYENDATLTSAEIRHFRVASWTKNVDLFEKDMIIIPICEESHWYLLLVVKPGITFLPFKTKERKERGEPFMIVLDSVGGRNNTAVKNIRRYLACEWNKKKCDGAELLTNLEQMGKKMNTLRPNKPEQENNSDCGIFLLLYVDKVFQNVSAFLWPFLVNSRTREWFTSEEVAGKRGEIAQLIKRLTKEQKPGELTEFPNIKFTAKGVEEVKEAGSRVECT